MTTHRVKNINKIRGSATLEYTIVFPLVLLVIFALFYLGFVLHQRTVLDSAVSRGTVYAARLLSDPQYATITDTAGGNGDALDFASGSYNFDTKFSIQPYRYIFNYSGKSYQDKVKNKVQAIIAANSIWGNSSDVSVEYKYQNFVLYQQITITAEQIYPLPKILALVGVDTELKLKAQSVQAVTDSDEFIRNVDLTIDVIKMITGVDIADKMQNGSKEILKKIENVCDKIGKFSGALFGKK